MPGTGRTCGTRGSGCPGSPSPEAAGSSGAGTPVGGGSLCPCKLINTAAHRLAERTVRAARAPLRVSRCPFPDCVPHAPPPVRWRVSPDPMHPPRSRGQVDRTSELARKLERKRGSGTCRFRAGKAAGVRMEGGRSGA